MIVNIILMFDKALNAYHDSNQHLYMRMREKEPEVKRIDNMIQEINLYYIRRAFEYAPNKYHG